jgi:hypothetical protein
VSQQPAAACLCRWCDWCRRAVDAWGRHGSDCGLLGGLAPACRAVGGLEAERAERLRIKEEAAAADRRNFEFMQELRRSGFKKVRAAPCSHPGPRHVRTLVLVGVRWCLWGW